MRKQQALLFSLALAVALLGTPLVQAQDVTQPAPPQSSGWRSVGDAPPADPAPAAGTLTLPAGTWIKVFVDQEISSDQNMTGDAFAASLAQPLVANGMVIARRGQTVEGRVMEAEKAGRAKGTSRLGIALTELSLVDGQQAPIHTTLVQYQGGTSMGRDAAGVATTTGMGAALGAAIEGGGFGAGMGAIAGAAAGIVGVLSTRGRPTVVYPESQLTFRIDEPLTISTANSAGAFRPVEPGDYAQDRTLRTERRGPTAPPPPPYYYGWDWPYGGFYPPYFYGPRLFFYSGPRFYGRRGFGRRW